MRSQLIRGSILLVSIQAVGSIIIFLASTYLVDKVGFSGFGKFATIYGFFILISSLSALGLPEYFQVWVAKNPTERGALNVPIVGYIFVILILFIGLIFAILNQLVVEWDLETIHFMMLPFALIGFNASEMACRAGFQAGYIVIPQIVSSLMSVFIWIWLVLSIYSDNSINIFTVLLLSYSILGLPSFIYLLFRFRSADVNFFLFLPSNLGKKAFLARVSMQILDVAPLTITQLLGVGALSGIYAYIFRFFGPIGMVSSSLIMQLQRNAFARSKYCQISLKPFILNLAMMLVFGALLAVASPFIFKEANNDIFGIGTGLQMLLIFFVCSYRAIFIAFQFLMQVYFQQINIFSIFLVILITLLVSLLITNFSSSIDINMLPIVFLGLVSCAVGLILSNIKIGKSLQ